MGFNLGSSTGLLSDTGHGTAFECIPCSFVFCLLWTVSSSGQRRSFVRHLYQGKHSEQLTLMVFLLVIVPSSNFFTATVSVPWEQ